MNKLLILLILLLDMSIGIKHVLHMFQQNRYELPRYTAWLKQSKFDKQDVVVLVITVIIFLIPLVISIKILIMLYLLGFGLIKFIIEYRFETNKQYIKPLKMTGRVKRQVLTIFCLNVIWIILWLTLGMRYWTLAFILSLFINWLLVYPMYYINEPFETVVKNHFLKQAEHILIEHNDLIKIGITGSYGKTSTKNILNAVLSDEYYTLMTPASYNTPMGITITIREMLKPLHEVFICEMGADKVGEIDFLMNFVKPRYGIVTSIGPQHLNTFKSMDNIISEKMTMIENLPTDGIGFVNMDNEYIANYHIMNTCRIVTYGIMSVNVDYRVTQIDYSPYGSSFVITDPDGFSHKFETKLLGEHNIMNILVSVALARELKINWDQLKVLVKQIDHIEHRLELKKINGYTFIDNAFNSNPEAARMSLQVLSRMPNKRIIVTPGMIDLGERQDQENKSFGKQMLGKVDLVILVGKAQTLPITEGLKEVGFDQSKIIVVDTVRAAFDRVYQIADINDTILLENDLPDAFNK